MKIQVKEIEIMNKQDLLEKGKINCGNSDNNKNQCLYQ